MEYQFDEGALRFDKDGLIPAVIQDADTGRVLTLAYMNRESLAITLEEKRTCFFSRSRQALWRKGETSGNVQRVVRVTADCDGDALIVEVEPSGPACHTGQESCFHHTLYSGGGAPEKFTLRSLYALIAGRKAKPQEGSYTTYLFSKGKEKILKKVGEECAEVIIGAMKSNRTETINEIADLAYHLLVLMAEQDIAPEEIHGELECRHVVDHKVKQGTVADG